MRTHVYWYTMLYTARSHFSHLCTVLLYSFIVAACIHVHLYSNDFCRVVLHFYNKLFHYTCLVVGNSGS